MRPSYNKSQGCNLEPTEVRVEFPTDGVTVGVLLTRVADRRYRIDSVPLFVTSACFGDTIEVEPIANEELRFIRIAVAGGWRMFMFIKNEEQLERPASQSFLEEVTVRGGYWERVFGGLLFIYLPPGDDFDPTPQVASL